MPEEIFFAKPYKSKIEILKKIIKSSEYIKVNGNNHTVGEY